MVKEKRGKFDVSHSWRVKLVGIGLRKKAGILMCHIPGD
jgi:hypothetical protein